VQSSNRKFHSLAIIYRFVSVLSIVYNLTIFGTKRGYNFIPNNYLSFTVTICMQPYRLFKRKVIQINLISVHIVTQYRLVKRNLKGWCSHCIAVFHTKLVAVFKMC